MTLAEALELLRAGLAAQGARFAVVGGLAVSAIAFPRFTRDVDVAVTVDSDAAAESLIHQLTSVGWTLAAVIEQDATGRLAQARIRPPGLDPVTCDLLFASSGIEAQIVGDSRLLEILPGLVVPVAVRGHLIAMKVLSVDEERHQDRLDLEALVQGADARDREIARQATDAIVAAGANRGRDLLSILGALPWITNRTD